VVAHDGILEVLSGRITVPGARNGAAWRARCATTRSWRGGPQHHDRAHRRDRHLTAAVVTWRVAALLLAGFCLLTALLVHWQPADPGQMLHFMKNCCMAGGFLVLLVQGGGEVSLGHTLKLTWS